MQQDDTSGLLHVEVPLVRVHGVAHGDDAKSLKEGTSAVAVAYCNGCDDSTGSCLQVCALGVLLHPTYDRWYDAMVDQRVPALVVTAIGYGHKRCATTLLHRWQGQMPLGGIDESLYAGAAHDTMAGRKVGARNLAQRRGTTLLDVGELELRAHGKKDALKSSRLYNETGLCGSTRDYGAQSDERLDLHVGRVCVAHDGAHIADDRRFFPCLRLQPRRDKSLLHFSRSCIPTAPGAVARGGEVGQLKRLRVLLQLRQQRARWYRRLRLPRGARGGRCRDAWQHTPVRDANQLAKKVDCGCSDRSTCHAVW